MLVAWQQRTMILLLLQTNAYDVMVPSLQILKQLFSKLSIKNVDCFDEFGYRLANGY